MIFAELIFFLFFGVVLGAHRVLPSHRTQKLWLLLASYFFYGYWDYRFLALILLSTTVDFLTARGLGSSENPRKRKLLVALSLTVNLGVLGFFKYFGFFVDSIATLAGAVGVELSRPTLEIILPVGISFFTFQSMSYTLDVYRRELAPRRNFLDYALYVSFFPQLVAGPIVRARTFLPQLDAAAPRHALDVRRALCLFAVGYFKKACIADNLASAIDPLFADPSAYSAVDRGLSAVLYSLQIYCDFSGYSDMAIAVAGLLGYELPKNFDAPYFSRNVREFWQRWHITLSTWLRDYLYVPLGGNRGGPWFVARNLMITMVLGGLWHGANYTFLLWGFLHGAALVIHRTFQRRSGTDPNAPGASGTASLVPRALTFAWVVFCFTIFRTPDAATAWEFFTASTKVESGAELSAGLFALVPALALAHALLRVRRGELVGVVRRAPDAAFYPALGTVAALLVAFTSGNAAPFIYFQF